MPLQGHVFGDDPLHHLLAPALTGHGDGLVVMIGVHGLVGIAQTVAALDDRDFVVGLRRGRDHRPEKTHPPDAAGQEFHDPHRDQELAAVRLQGNDIKAIGHC